MRRTPLNAHYILPPTRLVGYHINLWTIQRHIRPTSDIDHSTCGGISWTTPSCPLPRQARTGLGSESREQARGNRNGHPDAQVSICVHTVATEGVLTPDGRFHAVVWPGKRDLEERFRRRFLNLLEKAERLSASFHETLLSWRRSGFSVDATQRVGAGEEKRMERLARYATRAPLAAGVVRERPDGRIEIDTPPDPKTGSTVKVLDRLDFVHALCQQIPDQGLHQIRYRGAYSNAKRRALRQAFEARGESAPSDVAPGGETSVRTLRQGARGFACAQRFRRGRATFVLGPDAPEGVRGRAVDLPSLSRREMVIVAWITEAAVIDRILKHRRERGLVSPFESRAPPPG